MVATSQRATVPSGRRRRAAGPGPLLIAALVLLLLVIVLHLLMVWGWTFPGDRWAIGRESYSPAPAVHAYVALFSHLGTFIPAAVILIIAAGLLLKAGHANEAIALAAAYLAVAVNAVLKLILGPTPIWVAAGNTTGSYPSGHVTFATAVIGFIGVLGWRHGQRWVTAVAALAVVLMGPARLITGIHLVSDVVGGYLLGAAGLLLALATARVVRQG